MNRYKYIILTVLCAINLSCSGPFDMKLDDEPIIYLEAYPGLDEMIELKISPAYSKSNSALKPEFKPLVRFTVNGQEVPVTLNKDYCVSEKYESESYIADYKPVPGDMMTIEVSSEGFKSVYAETSIPEVFPERKIDYKKIEIGEDEYNMLYVTLKDDEATDIAYGISLFRETTIQEHPFDNDTTYYDWFTGYQIRDDYDFAPNSMDGMSIQFKKFNKDSYNTYMRLSGWDDDTFNGKQKTLSMALDNEPYEGTYERPIFSEEEYNTIIGSYKATYRYKLQLFTFSEEFFKYKVAEELGSENAGFFAGIAPSNFCYTNVVNGYGVFAGVCSVQTDWITPEFIEKNR